MITKQITRGHPDLPGYQAATARIPERADIENCRPGTLAPNCWGQMAEVTEVFATGIDQNGRAHVHYYTRDGDRPGSTVSGAMKIGELVRTVPLTCILNSNECDVLEAEMQRAAFGRILEGSRAHRFPALMDGRAA